MKAEEFLPPKVDLMDVCEQNSILQNRRAFIKKTSGLSLGTWAIWNGLTGKAEAWPYSAVIPMPSSHVAKACSQVFTSPLDPYKGWLNIVVWPSGGSYGSYCEVSFRLAGENPVGASFVGSWQWVRGYLSGGDADCNISSTSDSLEIALWNWYENGSTTPIDPWEDYVFHRVWVEYQAAGKFSNPAVASDQYYTVTFKLRFGAFDPSTGNQIGSDFASAGGLIDLGALGA
ncbi:hypothetical protein OJ996_11925 [Luteolibacter sp. GHJ8]|uniref:Uncharacterized protein n=1 Tax=Luteolibacter rhizosphaerae TaxID=2989719 RepID=A0ABT3G367_9BACT|nr:hypothetical protein [Luteolibacter rhizosphaerae]MCW1914288.1 hypothetical protein [Luteolibacter rhizosphaerae]